MFAVLLGTPLLGALLLGLLGAKRWAPTLNVVFSALTFLAACVLTSRVITHGNLVVMREQFFIDAFNVFLVTLTAFVGLTTSIFSRPYMRIEAEHGRAAIEALGTDGADQGTGPALSRTTEGSDSIDSLLDQIEKLGDDDIEELARQALAIEEHYGRAMDIEWGKDGADGRLYILQARPETVKSRAASQMQQRYHLKQRGTVLTTGRSIGARIGAGTARLIPDTSELHRVQPGNVIVTDMTDPDWEPVMKRASAIVTNRGGRTCHAAIIARELGIPATFFISTSFITERRLYWWERISLMMARARNQRGQIHYPRRIEIDMRDPRLRNRLNALIKNEMLLDVDRFLEELGAALGVEWSPEIEAGYANEMIMTWDQVRALARETWMSYVTGPPPPPACSSSVTWR